MFDVSKVTDMSYMFNNCFNLKYLDIQNFLPLKLDKMDRMLFNLSSLLYLNIDSLELNENTTKNSSFSHLASNLKICANKEQMKKYLLNQTQIKFNNCSDICFIKNIKLDLNKNECIYSCKDNEYNYELNNICYHQCPNGTLPVLKDEMDNDVFLCLNKKPEDYYLDENGFYKKCFNNCRSCFGVGNEKDNNCSKCKDNFSFLNGSTYILKPIKIIVMKNAKNIIILMKLMIIYVL